jgi:hypothetical protein
MGAFIQHGKGFKFFPGEGSLVEDNVPVMMLRDALLVIENEKESE